MTLQAVLCRLIGGWPRAIREISYPVEQFPQFEYSKRAVIRAGDALKDRILWVPDKRDEILKIFQIANSWRASHAFPMHRLKAELHGRMSALHLKGLTAARLKRMPSIRSKLARLPGNLSQIQDLGGCRAVVPTIGEARKLVESIKKKFRHERLSEDPYMDSPRPSGYRSHHLIYGFQPRYANESAFEGRRIEIQVRTRLQHSWATAVEAVGLYAGDDLKSGVGDVHWLRLFELMAAEMAAIERCAPDDNPRKRSVRVDEIFELNAKLDALQTLDTLSHAVADAEVRPRTPNYKPKYCLIRYDHSKRTVSVRYLSSPIESTDAYGIAESADQKTGLSKTNAVLVEVDKISDLRKAYPNYFGDVQLFKKNLTEIVHGKDAKEYSLPPVERVPPPPKEIPDDSWLRQPWRRRWTEPTKKPRGRRPGSGGV